MAGWQCPDGAPISNRERIRAQARPAHAIAARARRRVLEEEHADGPRAAELARVGDVDGRGRDLPHAVAGREVPDDLFHDAAELRGVVEKIVRNLAAGDCVRKVASAAVYVADPSKLRGARAVGVLLFQDASPRARGNRVCRPRLCPDSLSI